MYVCINNEVVLLNKWWFNKGLLQVVCVLYSKTGKLHFG